MMLEETQRFDVAHAHLEESLSMRELSRRPTLFEPASYVIRIQGALDPDWSDRIGGLHITVISAGRQTATELSGELPDQAALMGVLTSLYDLGMPLLSVERLAR
jgi:hypothetical protein